MDTSEADINRDNLFYAIERGDTEDVKSLLRSGIVSSNACDERGMSALIHCLAVVKCKNRTRPTRHFDSDKLKREMYRADLPEGTGHEILRDLLYYGAHPNDVDNDGRTASYYAAAKGLVECLKVLVEFGTDMDFIDSCGNNLLTVATQFENYDCVSYLIQLLQPRHRNLQNCNGETPLEIAIKRGDVDIVKLLLSYGAGFILEHPDTSGLYDTLRDSNPEIVKLLLVHWAQFNIEEDPPLLWALKSCGLGWLELFLNAGAQTEETNPYMYNDCTALMIALKHKKAATVKMLVDHGASVNVKTANGHTPIMFAARRKYGSVKCLKLLLNLGADIDAKDDKWEQSALMFALQYRNRHAAQLLLKWGARVNDQDANGRTPLMTAADIGDSISVEDLFSAGAVVDTKDCKGRTALMLALKYEKKHAAQFLLTCGARVNEQDANGRTPLMIAAAWGDSNLVEDLLDAGAVVDTKDCNGRTALFYSVRKFSDQSVLHILIHHGANVNAVDYYGDSVLNMTLNVFHFKKTFYDPDVMRDNWQILTLLNHGANFSVGQESQKYFRRMVLENRDEGLQFVIVNGFSPCVFIYNLEGPWSLSISALEKALETCNPSAARYFLANRFLTQYDVTELPKKLMNGYMWQGDDDETIPEIKETENLIRIITEHPFSLWTLSFVAVSSALEQEKRVTIDDPTDFRRDYLDSDDECDDSDSEYDDDHPFPIDYSLSEDDSDNCNISTNNIFETLNGQYNNGTNERDSHVEKGEENHEERTIESGEYSAGCFDRPVPIVKGSSENLNQPRFSPEYQSRPGPSWQVSSEDRDRPGPSWQVFSEDQGRPGPSWQVFSEDQGRPGPSWQVSPEDRDKPSPRVEDSYENQDRPGPSLEINSKDLDRPGPSLQHSSENQERPSPRWKITSEDSYRPGPRMEGSYENQDRPGPSLKIISEDLDRQGPSWQNCSEHQIRPGLSWQVPSEDQDRPGQSWQVSSEDSYRPESRVVESYVNRDRPGPSLRFISEDLDRPGPSLKIISEDLNRPVTSWQYSSEQKCRPCLNDKAPCRNPDTIVINNESPYGNIDIQGSRSPLSTCTETTPIPCFEPPSLSSRPKRTTTPGKVCPLPFKKQKLSVEDTSSKGYSRPVRNLTRREKIECLPLPNFLKKALSFQTKTAAMDPSKWLEAD